MANLKDLFSLLRKLINGCIWYFTPHTEEPLEPLPGCLCGGCTEIYFVCSGCREKGSIVSVPPCRTHRINDRYYCLDCAAGSVIKRQNLERLLK
jgi:hypothetical protein